MDRWIIVVLLGTTAVGVRAGMALYAIGLARSKNAASSAIRQVCDFLVSILAFCAVGSIIVFYKSGSGVVADLGITFHPPADNVDAIFFYAITFSFASAVVSGVVGERSRFFPMLAVPALLGAIVIPLAAHWGWYGWLTQMKFADSAGACIIHLAGGACALVAAILVGPRMGKFNHDGSSNAIPGHNLTLTTAGVALMTIAWLPYILGGIVLHSNQLGPQPAINVLLAASAGGLVALLYSRLRYGKADILLTFSGLLGGLVAISASAGAVRLPGAILIGGIAGILVPIASVAIDLIGRIDDPTAGISIHGVGGLWGTLAAGLFTADGIGDKLRMIGVQAIGALVVIALAAVATLALLAILRATVGIRSKEADEFDGLDLAEHDINAYPDFQQTMIKSYHLREA